MDLSLRLSAIVRHLPEQGKFADIGSDHAFLPVYFCLQHPEVRAVAGEVNEGPLASARAEIERHGLQDRIEARLGDGLAVVKPNEVSSIVIAGMGGPLIASILEKGKDRLQGVDRLLLQPNIHAVAVRQWLDTNGFPLIHEEILEENGHIYEVLIADRQSDRDLYTSRNKQTELWLGPLLMKKKEAPFVKKWKKHADKNERILKELEQSSENQHQKKKELLLEMEQLKEVLKDGDMEST